MEDYRKSLQKGTVMITLFSILGVACFTIAAMVLTTAPSIGVLEGLIAALFGFGAFVCAFVVGALAIAKHTANKVMTKARQVKGFFKK